MKKSLNKGDVIKPGCGKNCEFSDVGFTTRASRFIFPPDITCAYVFPVLGMETLLLDMSTISNQSSIYVSMTN